MCSPMVEEAALSFFLDCADEADPTGASTILHTWLQPPDTEVAQSSGFSAWSGMGRYFKNSHQSNLKKISSSSLLRKGLAPTPGRLLLTSSVLLLLPS